MALDALAAAPYVRLLGACVEAASDETLRLRLGSDEAHANRNRTVHGGVTASLVAIAGAALADPGGKGRTVDFSIRYVAAARGDALVADAALLGRRDGVAAVEVTIRAGDTVVAIGHVVRTGPEPAGPMCEPAPVAVALPADLDTLVPSQSPFSARLGVRSVWRESGRVVALLPFGADVAHPDGRLHEGAIASVCDTAGGGASWSVVGFDRERRASTVGMRISFHALPLGDDAIAEARGVGHDDRLFQNLVTVRARTTGALVATGWVTYRIVPV